MEKKRQYVLGIEGSANKIGIGKFEVNQVSSIMKGILLPTQEKHLWLHLELDFYPEKQLNIMPKKSYL